MIPLRDELSSRTRPVATVALIVANSLVFLYQLGLSSGAGERFVFRYGAIPALLTGRFQGDFGIPPSLTILSSMFVHGGLLHYAGNMLFLWIFGDNIEDVMGHLRYLLFYILAGYAAALAYAWSNPGSRIPMVGASGAISGVLGAYIVLFPRARIMTMVFWGFVMDMVRVPAFFFLAFWFLLQFFNGVVNIGSRGGGVAWLAHVGGFVAGIILVLFFRRRERLAWYRRQRALG